MLHHKLFAIGDAETKLEYILCKFCRINYDAYKRGHSVHQGDCLLASCRFVQRLCRTALNREVVFAKDVVPRVGDKVILFVLAGDSNHLRVCHVLLHKLHHHAGNRTNDVFNRCQLVASPSVPGISNDAGFCRCAPCLRHLPARIFGYTRNSIDVSLNDLRMIVHFRRQRNLRKRNNNPAQIPVLINDGNKPAVFV